MDDDINEIKPDTSRLLMSDQLRGMLPSELDDPNDQLASIAKQFVIVILGRVKSGDEKPLVGRLDGFMSADTDVEIEVKTTLEDAFDIIKSAPDVVDKASDVVFSFIELHLENNVTRFEPPRGYALAGVRITSIDDKRQMCVLLLNLRRNA